MIGCSPSAKTRRNRRQLLACGLLLAAVSTGCAGPDPRPATTVFSPAHATASAAVRDFLNIRPAVTQPFPFPHRTHAEKNLGCTDYCHEAVAQGPRAGLPSVGTCMGCHEYVATDRPLIRELAALSSRGTDINWARVYGFSAQAHVRFNHVAHVRKDVACSTCHGPIEQQTVAQRNVELTMGFCVDCHQTKRAPNECVTCHY